MRTVVALLVAVVSVAAMQVGLVPPAAAAPGDEKIIGGSLAGDQFPEVVFLHIDDAWGCTGTLIDPSWVLTAAHCIGDEGVVAGGGTNILDLTWSIEIDEMHAHPAYTDDAFAFDYGLIELEEAADVDVNVELADYQDGDLWEPGRALSALGYGLVDGLLPTNDLMYAELDVKAEETCQGDPSVGVVYDPSTMLCLHRSAVSLCSGDSGGPIFAVDDGRLRLVGITSFGPDDCGGMSVAAWVPGGLSWIESVMGGGGDEGATTVYRLFGADRYGTAANVASSTWGNADTVYVSTGENYPDSLAAGPAAASRIAPILLVTGSGVPESTALELERLEPQRIVVVGGSAAVGDAVVDELRSHAPTVERVFGATRIDTAVALSESAFTSADHAYLAPSTSFQDPLIAASAAAVDGVPLLLSAPGAPLAQGVIDELARLGVSSVLLVGDSAFATPVLQDQLFSLGITPEV
ncbi:MAG TPA: trypsin-like serine protease, partial [Acidimicrobiales bacterium]|nr:trypsin-like serine protease [Acidimicrobiales bacterium]